MADYQGSYAGYARSTMPRVSQAERTDNWIENWLNGGTPESALWDQYGFQPQQFYAVVIYRVVGPTPAHPQWATILGQEAVRRHVNGPVLSYHESGVLFHPIEDPQQTQRLKRLTEEIRERLAARFPDSTVCCGVGRPARGIDDLRQSFREAHDAATLCQEMGPESRSTFFGDFSLYRLLLSLKDPDDLRVFCTKWLNDLVVYDDQQHSDLLVTLRVYFDNNGNTARTASQLNIHRNTLAYRLNRIAEITRLDLDDADVRLNLQLALKARHVLTTELAH